MKSLENYVIKEQLKDYLKHNEEEFSYDYLLYNEFIDNFIKDDNITETKVNSFFSSIYIGQGEYINYPIWQSHIYETLNNIIPTSKLVDELKEKFKSQIKEINIKNLDAEFKQIEINTDNNENFIKNKEFISLCNFACYEIINKDNFILLKPIRGKEVINQVHKLKYIYHITQKYIYDNMIKKHGIIPKAKDGSQVERIYFSTSNENKDKIESLAYLKFRYVKMDGNIPIFNNAKKGYVLLTINVDKLNPEIKFFEDSGAKGLSAVWTCEYIPPYAITNVEKLDLSKYNDSYLK